MKVKIDNTVYDGLDEPVMVILSARDKKAIAELAEDDNRYCHYPTGMDIVDINEWMNQDGKQEVDNPVMKQMKRKIRALDQTVDNLMRENYKLEPVLLDMYVCALLAGGFYKEKIKFDKLETHIFEQAEWYIKTRNKRLGEKTILPKNYYEGLSKKDRMILHDNADIEKPEFPKKSPVRELREDEAGEEEKRKPKKSQFNAPSCPTECKGCESGDPRKQGCR